MTTSEWEPEPEPLGPALAAPAAAPIQVAGHLKPRRRLAVPLRRWHRRLLVIANLVVAMSLVSVSVVFGYVRYRVSQVKMIKLPSLTAVRPPRAGGGTAAALPAMNILLVGSNTRTGLSPGEAAQFGSGGEVPGARSDVTMIVHLDPATGAASLLSIPRDLFVPLPPHSVAGAVGKIDAALNDGPNNLITAITSDLGIPINHFVEVNFDGFQRTIDAVGGVDMSFPTPLRDVFSNLTISKTGCQHLDGATALAVVRARHLQYFSQGRWIDDPQSDLSRIRRDHTFLTLFVNAAKAQTTNPLRLNALAGGLLSQVTVDSGLNVNTMLELFRSYRHINPDAVPQTTLPITVVGNYHFAGGAYGDVDMPVEPLDRQVITAWGGQPSSRPIPSSIKVRVVNISGTYAKGSAIAGQLGAIGFPVEAGGNVATPASPTETVLHYHPGSVDQALEVLGSLSGAIMMYPDPAVADGSVTAEVGSLVSVTPTSSPTPSQAATIPTAGGQAPSSSSDQAAPFDPTACK